MLRIHTLCLIGLAAPLLTTAPSLAHGGGGGGGHSGGGGHFGGGSHMSFSSHSSGSSHIGTSEHSAGFEHKSMSSFTGHQRSFFGRLFGFGPSARQSASSPNLAKEENAVPARSNLTFNGATNLVAMQSTPHSLFFNPYLHAYNPFLNYGPRRYFPFMPWGYPYVGSYWGSTFPYNIYSPWFMPYYYPPLLFGYLDPYYYALFDSSLYFPYTTAFADSSALDPNFVPLGDSNWNNSQDNSAYNSANDGWAPPAYDPSLDVVDPQLVPFDMSLPRN
jgi:hypothetical protein